ncbi:MAG TPA: YqaJ viral recombinase family protein [Alphaproteobacteria bacterium]|nr:YqaJ viral recombinase family protein [Alphaproteobacteria bacterium]
MRTKQKYHGIGGSDAGRVMAGDWFSLWEEKTGRREPEDLTDVLQVQIGIVTEPLNLWWFERRTGIEVFCTGCEDLVHPDHAFMRANLDAWVPGGILECKHTSAFAKDEEIVARYFPQVQHYLAVTDTSLGYLSVIFGNHRWAFFELEADEAYRAELIAREAKFWWHVETDTSPKNPAQEILAIALDDMREVSMEGNNEWGALADDWLTCREPAKHFDAANKGLKELVEPDVKLAVGYGVKVARSKAGALTVRELV